MKKPFFMNKTQSFVVDGNRLLGNPYSPGPFVIPWEFCEKSKPPIWINVAGNFVTCTDGHKGGFKM